MNPYDGPRAKLDRAHEHLEKLKSELERDRQLNRYGFADSCDLQTRECVLYINAPGYLFARYSVLAGEAIGQMRSALDHIIWQLVPAPVEQVTGMPVVRDHKDYQKRAAAMIAGINNSAATIIEAAQPFNDGGAKSRLYILNEMWKRDKHRVLNLVLYQMLAYKRIYVLANGEVRAFIHDIAPDLEDGAEAIRYAHPDFYKPEMRMVETVWVSIHFRDSGPATGHDPIELLTDLFQFTESLVNNLIATKP
jgi:hypothetical protein